MKNTTSTVPQGYPCRLQRSDREVNRGLSRKEINLKTTLFWNCVLKSNQSGSRVFAGCCTSDTYKQQTDDAISVNSGLPAVGRLQTVS
ncbi:hypothetical protein J6590_018786 [Homalodisca vitripennis]|nr:hypothetical protein J6590_018786 [Homalodisca vitripennis]